MYKALYIDLSSDAPTMLFNYITTETDNKGTFIKAKKEFCDDEFSEAMKLAACFKNTTAEFWLHVQDNYDHAQIRNTVDTRHVKVLWEPAHIARA